MDGRTDRSTDRPTDQAGHKDSATACSALAVLDLESSCAAALDQVNWMVTAIDDGSELLELVTAVHRNVNLHNRTHQHTTGTSGTLN